jgi:cytochrome c-type biogenesis protein
MTSTTPSVGLAFAAGFVSFVSPCVLPLVPAYLSLLTGESVEELKGETPTQARVATFSHAFAFVIGFSTVFIVLGLAASAVGSVLSDYRVLITQIGGILVAILGLQMMGMLRIPFLMMDTRKHLQYDRRTFWTSLVVGMAFAAGWSPCIGSTLAPILTLASRETSLQALTLLLAYSFGLALPFLITAAAIGVVLPLLNSIKRFLPAIEFASGAFMVVVGLVLVNNAFLQVAGWFYQFVPTPTL